MYMTTFSTRLSLTLVFALFFVPNAEAGDSLKHYLRRAHLASLQWNADAQLVRAGGNSNVSLNGDVRCKESTVRTGWTFTFRSPSKDQYFQFLACKENVEAGPIGRGFPRAPTPITEDFIDTNKVGKIVGTIAKGWGYSNCHMVAGVRSSGEEPKVDESFPKGVPLWEASLYCDRDKGGFVFIDGRSGKVLKSYESPKKGD